MIQENELVKLPNPSRCNTPLPPPPSSLPPPPSPHLIAYHNPTKQHTAASDSDYPALAGRV